jgi:tripartite-type tricarboxylate transporter receptor subunit TctC
VITRLNTQLQRVLQRYDVKERCASLGVEAKTSLAAAFSAQIKSECTRHVRLIKDIGITPEQGCAGQRAPRLPEVRHN